MWLWLAIRDVAFHPGELFLLLEQCLFSIWNQQVPVNLSVDEREAAIAIIVGAHQANFVHDNVRIEARIVCCFKQKAEHALQIIGVARPRDDDVRNFVLAQTVGRGVADCAVVRDPRESDDLFRKADRNFMAFFPNNAKRLVAARPGHQVWKNTRQDHPEIIRNAAVALGAKRAVFEMFLLVRKHFFLFPEKFCPRKDGPKREHDHNHSRGDPNDAFCFWLEVHWFIDRALLKMFSDIQRSRLFPRLIASCRIPSLRGQRSNCPRSDPAASRRPASLACRT